MSFVPMLMLSSWPHWEPRDGASADLRNPVPSCYISPRLPLRHSLLFPPVGPLLCRTFLPLLPAPFATQNVPRIFQKALVKRRPQSWLVTKKPVHRHFHSSFICPIRISATMCRRHHFWGLPKTPPPSGALVAYNGHNVPVGRGVCSGLSKFNKSTREALVPRGKVSCHDPVPTPAPRSLAPGL